MLLRELISDQDMQSNEKSKVRLTKSSKGPGFPILHWEDLEGGVVR